MGLYIHGGRVRSEVFTMDRGISKRSERGVMQDVDLTSTGGTVWVRPRQVEQWKHVKLSKNPADLRFRGVLNL